MMKRSAFLLLLAACTSNEDPTGGAGGAWNIGGASVFEGVSPSCRRYVELAVSCFDWTESDARGMYERCTLFDGCQAELEAFWGCNVDALEKNCDAGACSQTAQAVDICVLTAATCEAQPNSCECVGLNFKPGNTIVTCEVLAGEPAGGAGGSGGASQVVQCTCAYGDQLSKICQQDGLDCSLATSCCSELQ